MPAALVKSQSVNRGSTCAPLKMKAGVISLQGAAPEHLRAFETAMCEMGMVGEAVSIRRRAELDEVDCLAIPGGESTTIAKLLKRFDLFDRVRALATEGMPIMGTCAGCVLLAKEGDAEVERTGTELLGLMDMRVKRNAFGRQRESFEAELKIEGMDGSFPAIFIRGPVIERVWGNCRPLSVHDGMVVMARQENLLALSFHPELSGDTRVHRMLLELV
jgi:5'-phosphate synthase pdxT subunit